jgi:hypothetical protein
MNLHLRRLGAFQVFICAASATGQASAFSTAWMESWMSTL